MSLDLTETRYDRQERISWWDQSRLRAGRVLVVGAGAIGNELVKNLTLVGVGEIDVVDMDLIEHTNLARCVFFREGDEGKPKALALAEAAQALNSDVRVRAFVGTVQSLGSGSLADYDLVLGGLDNREARLWVNRTCRRLGKFFIDAAIEGLHGVVRTFGPEGACYECTLTEVDWQILSHRKSCALLGVDDMLAGKTPTNATTASVVAAIQVQEAIKYLVGRTDLLALVGKQWTYLGEQMVTYTSIIDEDPDCMAHDSYHDFADDVYRPSTLSEAVQHLGLEAEAWLDLTDDFITLLDCPRCATGALSGLRSVLPKGVGACQTCGDVLPAETTTSLSVASPALLRTFDSIAWPRCEIVSLRTSSYARSLRIWRDPLEQED